MGGRALRRATSEDVQFREACLPVPLEKHGIKKPTCQIVRVIMIAMEIGKMLHKPSATKNLNPGARFEVAYFPILNAKVHVICAFKAMRNEELGSEFHLVR